MLSATAISLEPRPFGLEFRAAFSAFAETSACNNPELIQIQVGAISFVTEEA